MVWWVRSIVVVISVLFFAPSAFAAQSCEAKAEQTSATCSITCSPGEDAICVSGLVGASCTCKVGGKPVSGLLLSGTGTLGTAVQIDTFDITCDTLPCTTPIQMHSIQVPVSVGTTPAQFAQSAETVFQATYGPACGFAAVGDEIRMDCPNFFVKYRVCDPVPGECPDVFVSGTGTDADLGVDRAGLSFQSAIVPPPVPALDGLGGSMIVFAVIGIGILALRTRIRV